MKRRPLQDRVLIRRVEPKSKTAGGAGNEHGNLAPRNLKPGDPTGADRVRRSGSMPRRWSRGGRIGAHPDNIQTEAGTRWTSRRQAATGTAARQMTDLVPRRRGGRV
jgi:hypothetical protein